MILKQLISQEDILGSVILLDLAHCRLIYQYFSQSFRLIKFSDKAGANRKCQNQNY